MKSAMTTDNLATVQQAARELLPPSVVEHIEKAVAGRHPESELISVLHKLQGEVGFLGEAEMEAVAQLLRVPTSTVSGVATFYHFFHLQKMGRYVISLCTGTACYVKGADKVLAKLEEELGIRLGETTTDGLFSLVQARCLGMCGLAPVMMINDRVYEKVKPDDIPGLLRQCTEATHVPTE